MISDFCFVLIGSLLMVFINCNQPAMKYEEFNKLNVRYTKLIFTAAFNWYFMPIIA